MLILDVGKIKYNKKFYKTVIYTTLILNIFSYGIFPKSQSKYREELEYKYAVNLYREKQTAPSEIVNLKPNISAWLIEDDYRYQSYGDVAYFYYKIDATEHGFVVGGVNTGLPSTISVENSGQLTVSAVTNSQYVAAVTGEITCKVLDIQRTAADDDKGIIGCKFANPENTKKFVETGIKLNVEAKNGVYYKDNVRYNVDKTAITSTAIIGHVDYFNSVERIRKSNNKVLVREKVLDLMNKADDCNEFKTFVYQYGMYYKGEANKNYNVPSDKLNYNEITNQLYSYVGYDERSNVCNKDISRLGKGIVYEEINVDASFPVRYAYKVEDNFVGYALTKYRFNGSDTQRHQMYFSNKDGKMFTGSEEKSYYDDVLDYYLNNYYSTDDAAAVRAYVAKVTGNGGILDILKTTVENPYPGIYHDILRNGIRISEDYVYNLSSSRIRVKFKSPDMVSDLVSGLKRHMSLNTVNSMLAPEDPNNPAPENREKGLALDAQFFGRGTIRPAGYTQTFELKQVGDDGSVTGKNYTLTITSDGTYYWVDINLQPNASTIEYELYSSDSGESVLEKIQSLDKKYFGEIKHTVISKNPVDIIDSETDTKVGSVEIEFIPDSADESTSKGVIYRVVLVGVSNTGASMLQENNESGVEPDEVISSADKNVVDSASTDEEKADEAEIASDNSQQPGGFDEGRQTNQLPVDNTPDDSIEKANEPESSLDIGSDTASESATVVNSSNSVPDVESIETGTIINNSVGSEITQQVPVIVSPLIDGITG